MPQLHWYDPEQIHLMATLFESAASMPARPSPASRPRKSDAIESKRLLNWPFDGIHIEPPKFSMPVRTSDGHFLARGLPRAGHYLCAFQSKHRSLSTSHSEPAMPIVKARACTILGEFEQAQTELIGKAVILTDGKAGTVESVSLDELHGQIGRASCR